MSVYRPLLTGYLQKNFPELDADDVIQETLVAVVKVLPDFVYDPDERGHFRNWLIGVARHKAQDAKRALARDLEKTSRFANEPTLQVGRQEDDWRKDVAAVARRKLLADESYSAQSKMIFERVAINGESPAEVADQFGVSRNNVDQIKNRMIKRLQEIVDGLLHA